MKTGRRPLIALHLFLVWAVMTATVPTLGFALLGAAWTGGAVGTVPVLVCGVPVVVGLLSVAGLPAGDVVPLCGSASRRLGWAVLVFVLGTLGVLAGVAAYAEDIGLGSAGIRVVLTGVPYAVAASLFVPSRWVRLGALALLAGALTYGGFIGPMQAQQRQHEAEIAGYREPPDLLYLGAVPSGMQLTRAEVGPASSVLEYRPVRAGYETGYASLVIRVPITPTVQCPEYLTEDETCTVKRNGEAVTIDRLDGYRSKVTVTRRHRSVEVEASSQTLDEPELRQLLSGLHRPTDAELEELIREKKISRRF
ncbi:hypothetical protein OG242_31580 [Streptomyces sp. NBC_00727]|uniref:hypothetical protein n=1 Tax=Streptomyces sp. NBC_00727 TaxID=2903675 RepID=UPI00386D93D3